MSSLLFLLEEPKMKTKILEILKTIFNISQDFHFHFYYFQYFPKFPITVLTAIFNRSSEKIAERQVPASSIIGSFIGFFLFWTGPRQNR